MIFGNLSRIVKEHYISLAEETGLKRPYDYFYILSVFGFLPLVIGLILGLSVPIWPGFFGAAAPILAILTGFSFNALILLLRYSGEGNHPYQQQVVDQTRAFTLYSILTGIVIIILLVFGYIAIQATYDKSLSIVSMILYTSISHYLLSLLVIVHRLWTLTQTSIESEL